MLNNEVFPSLSSFPSVMPYQGSKRKLARTILPLIPSGTNTLIEPFAGSAAISLASLSTLKVSHVVLNDTNEPLMSLWKDIRDNPYEVTQAYENIWVADAEEAKEKYYHVRSRFNENHDPVDLLYLMTRCVKASIRYNEKGEFNQSPDNRRLGTSPQVMRRRILAASNVLKNTSTMTSQDFSVVLGNATTHDVVYLDPPYQGTSGKKDKRYSHTLNYEVFAREITTAVERNLSLLISYDGYNGETTYGNSLPQELGLTHLYIDAGQSTQSTLSSKPSHTIESLYLSPALVSRLDAHTLSLISA